jgi:hypothetical protein
MRDRETDSFVINFELKVNRIAAGFTVTQFLETRAGGTLDDVLPLPAPS